MIGKSCPCDVRLIASDLPSLSKLAHSLIQCAVIHRTSALRTYGSAETMMDTSANFRSFSYQKEFGTDPVSNDRHVLA